MYGLLFFFLAISLLPLCYRLPSRWRTPGLEELKQSLRRFDSWLQAVFCPRSAYLKHAQRIGLEHSSSVLDIGSADWNRVSSFQEVLQKDSVYVLQLALPATRGDARRVQVLRESARIDVLEFRVDGIDLPSESFDLLVLSQGLHSLAGYPGGFEDCLRLLKPGGLIAALQVLPGPGFHFPQEIFRALASHGFEDLLIQGHLGGYACCARKPRVGSNSELGQFPD